MELKPAICPYCGGDLRLPEDKTKVKCMYCGKDIIVRDAIERAIGPTIENYMTLAISARKSENNQEAYNYYTKVLELAPLNYEAWFGKGEAAGWLSKLDDFRLPEMVTGIENAVKFSPSDKKEEIKTKGAQMINQITTAFFNLSSKHVFDYGSSQSAREEFLVRCELMIKALEVAHSYSPHDKTIIDNMIYVCQMQIEGVQYKDFNEYGETRGILRVVPSYESLLKSKMDEYVEKRKALEPSYQPPTIQKKSGCFIVTATLGNCNHPYVILLREFRDEWLSKKVIGQMFIEKYYHHSPYFANMIRERKRLRWVSYTLVVKPSVWLVTKLLQKKLKE
jgi:predicted RNA-binding Zn-ribbon protein involved in translation (DUF1610 family)